MPARASAKKQAGAPRQSVRDRLRGLPPWMSAIAAVVGTLVTVLAVFGLIGAPPPPQPSPTVPPPTVLAPRVTIESLLIDGQQVEAEGAFEYVDPASQEVLFVGRPAAETTDLWVAVEAALSPSATIGSLQSGDWTAARPAPPDTPYRWRAIVWPSTSGAAAVDDLQLNGPDSRYVIARSDEWLDE